MIPDSIVESVDKLRASAGDELPTRLIVAQVIAQLADELPEHYGPGAQWAYRGWLLRRAKAFKANRAWQRTFLATD